MVQGKLIDTIKFLKLTIKNYSHCTKYNYSIINFQYTYLTYTFSKFYSILKLRKLQLIFVKLVLICRHGIELREKKGRYIFV